MRKVTVEDVARHAGVSTATVSRAVNGTGTVAQPTYQRVMSAVNELGYTPTPAARNLRQQRTRNIALVVPSIVNPFFPELVSAVHPGVTAQGYSLLLIDSQESEREALRVVTSKIADGVLLIGSTAASSGTTLMKSGNVPVVALDRAPSALAATVVQTENQLGAREVVDHLIERGHREIAHITGPTGIDVANQRTAGYRQSLERHGLEVREDLIRTGDFSEDSGFAATLDLVDAGKSFTAIFAANDIQAIGAIAALQLRGISVPEDVAVAGFDGIHLTRYVNPSLTTYIQPIKTIAQRATDLLLRNIAGITKPNDGEVLRFPGELVIRESSALRRA